MTVQIVYMATQIIHYWERTKVQIYSVCQNMYNVHCNPRLKKMATITFLIIATLYLEAAGQQTVAPVIITSDGAQTCPTQEDQRSAILNLRNDTWTMATNFSLAPECGDGLWKRVHGLSQCE